MASAPTGYPTAPPSPEVVAPYAVESEVALSGYTTTTFVGAARESFITTLANQMGVDPSKIVIIRVSGNRRRLMAASRYLHVQFKVIDIPKIQAETIQGKLKAVKADPAGFIGELEQQISTDGGVVPMGLTVSVVQTPILAYDHHKDTKHCIFGDCGKLADQCEYDADQKCFPSDEGCHRDPCTCCNFREAHVAAGHCATTNNAGCVQCCIDPLQACAAMTPATKQCADGSTVQRNPKTACSFFTCPTDCLSSQMHKGHCIKAEHKHLPGWGTLQVSHAAETVCVARMAGGSCTKYAGNPTLYRNPQIVGHPKYGRGGYHCDCPDGSSPGSGWRSSCPPDAFKCTDSKHTIVHRDSQNYCRFSPCPST